MSATTFGTYPVNLDLRGQRVLVVGGGQVAARKVAGLRRAGAAVTVVAPDAVAAIADDPELRWHRRRYRRGEAASYRLVITATDDAATNAQVARDGDAANVFVNAADDPSNCSFTLPAVVTRGNLQLTASTNGRSPAFARWAKHELEAHFTDVHAAAVELLGEIRLELSQQRGTTEQAGWGDAIDDELFLLIGAGRLDEARHRVRAALGLATMAAADRMAFGEVRP